MRRNREKSANQQVLIAQRKVPQQMASLSCLLKVCSLGRS
ncbi:hypothetical protein JD844_012164 [Phrynosoma platyrhinos]|uniref:Uncharacterized protein n=1 Tax=Phrynosoma platyrhinos TaxID=52577 RepID=A0ABQ7TJ63_PHRPL|nr:hypothetical protein JD844_012164 [Phrynosoma platyrhinos]